MARPSKTAGATAGHRTKDEIAQREAIEKSLASGYAMAERESVRQDAAAHAEFERVNKLMVAIKRNDALIEPVVNRYCKLTSECAEFERKRDLFSQNLDDLMNADGMEPTDKYRLEAQMQRAILDVDKQLQAKRKMLFDIEKENCMTVAATLRAIPKKPESTDNPLLEALKNGTD